MSIRNGLPGVSHPIAHDHLQTDGFPGHGVPLQAVVIFPDADTEAIESYRSRWDPLSDLVDAHLTLVFPVIPLPEEVLEVQLSDALSRVDAFPVSARRVQPWDDEYLFLVLERGADEIRLLHELLYDGPYGSAARPVHFQPHLTVGRTSGQDIDTAIADADVCGVALEGIASRVTIYRIYEDGARVRTLTLPLGV